MELMFSGTRGCVVLDLINYTVEFVGSGGGGGAAAKRHKLFKCTEALSAEQFPTLPLKERNAWSLATPALAAKLLETAQSFDTNPKAAAAAASDTNSDDQVDASFLAGIELATFPAGLAVQRIIDAAQRSHAEHNGAFVSTTTTTATTSTTTTANTAAISK
jgi:hypothetical protein